MATEKKANIRPMCLVKPGTISKEDIERAEKYCGFIIIECAEPEGVRFLEAPIDANLDEQARAAISLVRFIAAESTNTHTTFYGAQLLKRFIDAILAGSTIKPVARVKDVSK